MPCNYVKCNPSRLSYACHFCLFYPGFIADSVRKYDRAYLAAAAIMIFASYLVFLKKLTGRKDSSEENHIAFG